jgi:hypothetical protein
MKPLLEECLPGTVPYRCYTFFYETGDHTAQHANDGLLQPALPMIVCFKQHDNPTGPSNRPF